MKRFSKNKWEILLVEDNYGDVVLIEEAFAESEYNYNLTLIKNGGEVLEYLKSKDAVIPDIMILDLNLPQMNGKDILRRIKNDIELESIPVIIFTTSEAETDIIECYRLKANCYINKPVDFENFMDVIRTIEKFWVSIVTLPPQ